MEEFKNAFEGLVTTLEESPGGCFCLGILLVIFFGLMFASIEWRSRNGWKQFLVLSSLCGLGIAVIINRF